MKITHLNNQQFKLLLVVLVLFFLPLTSLAQEYVPLINLDLGGDSVEGGLAGYVNGLYYLSIGLAALLAVIKITIAGVKWMLSDVVTDKSQAKKDIQGSLFGLLIIISAVLVLNIINPSLTEVNFETSNIATSSRLGQDLTGIAPGGLVVQGCFTVSVPDGVDGQTCQAFTDACRAAGGEAQQRNSGEMGDSPGDVAITCITP